MGIEKIKNPLTTLARAAALGGTIAGLNGGINPRQAEGQNVFRGCFQTGNTTLCFNSGIDHPLYNRENHHHQYGGYNYHTRPVPEKNIRFYNYGYYYGWGDPGGYRLNCHKVFNRNGDFLCLLCESGGMTYKVNSYHYDYNGSLIIDSMHDYHLPYSH
ncbi:MAG: hypothetical protein SFT81_07755 [Candidatus Caenarcaniphilales bacterium]|nr:hypothetical protein [Candidatus Caenarcaniphilales bacterium]